MHAVLEGRDSLVVLPTGGGKSLCFQAPALVMEHAAAGAADADLASGPAETGHDAESAPDLVTVDDESLGYDVDFDALPAADASRSARPSDDVSRSVRLQPDRGRQGFAVVVSPLISLMKDQVDGLRVDGVEAWYLNSTQTAAERDEVFASLKADRCRLLYVSPERLVGEGSQGFRRMLAKWGVRFVAVDEAHCISQWGTISGRSTGNWGGCAKISLARRSTASPPRPPSASGTTSSPNSG